MAAAWKILLYVVYMASPPDSLPVAFFFFFFPMVANGPPAEIFQKGLTEITQNLSEVTQCALCYLLFYKVVTMFCPGSRSMNTNPTS